MSLHNRILTAHLKKRALEAVLETEARKTIGPVKSVAGVRARRKELGIQFADVLRGEAPSSSRAKLYAAINGVLTDLEKDFRRRGQLEDPVSRLSEGDEIELPSFLNPRFKEIEQTLVKTRKLVNQELQSLDSAIRELKAAEKNLQELVNVLKSDMAQKALKEVQFCLRNFEDCRAKFR